MVWYFTSGKHRDTFIIFSGVVEDGAQIWARWGILSTPWNSQRLWINFLLAQATAECRKQSMGNKVHKQKRILISLGFSFPWYFTELSLPLSHCPYRNSDYCEITAGMRDTLGKWGKCQAQIAVRMESFVCFSMMSVNHNCVWMLLAKRCCDFSARKLAFPAGTLRGTSLHLGGMIFAVT